MITQLSEQKYSAIIRRRAVKLFLALVVCLTTWPAAGAEQGELDGYSNLFANGISSSVVDAYLSAYGMSELTPVPYDVAVYRVLYWTLDATSNNIVLASGALQIPLSNGVPLNSPMPLLMYAHGTESYRWSVPSCPHDSPTGPYSQYLPLNSKTVEALPFSSDGYCVFAPDYAGLGFDTNSLITPYLIADREPIAVIDGIRAAQELASQINLNLNGRIFLTGYSQGGHVCLATHRMIEQEYSAEFRITAAAPGSAPADLTGSMSEAFRNHLQGGTAFATFATAAYQPRFLLWNDFSEVFLPAYTNVPNLFYGATSSLAVIAAQLPSTAQALFTSSLIQQATNPASLFAQTIASNNVYQWRAYCPITFFYAGGDITVPPSNSLIAYATMQALGGDVHLVNVGDTLNHVTGFGKIQVGILRFFDQYRQAASPGSPVMVDNAGNWYVWFSGSGYQMAGPWNLGVPGTPVAADFDGDRYADPAMVDNNGAWYVWFTSAGYQMGGPWNLGVSGAPLAADFDGDEYADPAMVDNSDAWYVWFTSLGYQMSGPWNLGVSGSPVAADFDGDRYADPAVVDNTGVWRVWFTSSGYQMGGPWNLGVSGTPVAADFDGDWYADPAVVDNTGAWRVWFTSSGYQLGGPWNLGVSGTPLAADFDGR